MPNQTSYLNRIAISLPLIFVFALLHCDLAMATSGSTQAPVMRFDHFLTEENPRGELKENVGAIRVIVQDTQGYMWIAGESGLVRFDAYEFKSFHAEPNHPNTICSTDIKDMLVDHTGVLWVGSSQGLCRWNPYLEAFSVIQAHKENEWPTTFENGKTTSAHLLTNYVEALDIDKYNRLYIASRTGLSILNSERDEFTHYIPDPSYEYGLSSERVSEVKVDQKNGVWIGTYGGGLNFFDPTTEQFTHWQHQPGVKNSLLSNNIDTITQDKDGNIWLVCANEGISRMDENKLTFTHYISEYNIDDGRDFDTRFLYVDSKDRLWAALDHGGLALYMPESDSFHAYTHSTFDSSSINSNQVRYIYEDTQNNLWVGSFPNGVNVYNKELSTFETLNHDPADPSSLSNNGILFIFEDSQKILWIGTESGLNRYDRTNNTFKRYQHNPHDPHSLRFNAVVSISEDHAGNLWVSTWSGGLHRFDRKTEKFYNYYPDPLNPNSLSSPYAWNTYVDKQGTLWIGTTRDGGLNRYRAATDDFIHYEHSPTNSNTLASSRINDVIEDHAGVFWVADMAGVDILDRNTGKVTRFKLADNMITRSPIRTLIEDSEGIIWLGTDGRGVVAINKNRDAVSSYDINNGLAASTVYSIVEDDNGDIWFGTIKGLSRFNKTTQSFRNFYKGDGIAGNNHNREAVFKDDDGKIYFGSTNGITVFHPNNITSGSSSSDIIITELKVQNRVITPFDSSSILKTVVGLSPSIKLKHSNSTFSIKFALLNFMSPYRNHYSYKLEGFDPAWNHVEDLRTATYTNIDPGEYTFKVKAVNKDGVTSNNVAHFNIEIAPAPWATWWAYLIYALIFLAFVFWVIRYQLKKIELEKQKALNKELVQLDKIKDRFLSSTSHELRTPLSGVISIAELMLSQKDLNNEDRDRNLNLISSCGRRLSHLINDILDYSKIVDNRLEINPETVDVHQSIDQIISLVQSIATPKNIQLISGLKQNKYFAFADDNRLQQILFNLMGNAIKYSDNGSIIISATTNQRFIEISVTDTGVGIAQEQQAKVFDSFHQIKVDGQHIRSGTGLGLSITKDLVELHGGKIWLKSEPDKGSCFSFSLPRASAEQIKAYKEKHACADSGHHNITHFHFSSSAQEATKEKFTIMIVDDHQINRVVMRDILEPKGFDVLSCDSGAAALQTLGQNPDKVDLILMDVSMPLMSGFEACSIIRETYNKEQLPIVFVSVDKTDEDLAASLDIGGNGFIEKPVSQDILLITVETFLSQNYSQRVDVKKSLGADS